MHAWHLQGDQLVRREHTEAPLGAAQIRVKVEHLCLTPSDLSSSAERIGGATLMGSVVETGEAASAWAGVRVMVPALQSCGECESCRRGFVAVCPKRVVLGRDIDGACASRVVADARWVTPLDKGLEKLSGPEAAFCCGPLLTAYGLFCRAGTGAGDIALILGQGPIASALSVLAKSRGTKVLRASEEHTIAELVSENNKDNLPMRIFVCDDSKGSDINNSDIAISAATPGSIIVTCVAAGSMDLKDLLEKELTLVALPFPHPDLLPETAALVAKGAVSLSELITTEVLCGDSPNRVKQAFDSGKCLVAHHSLPSPL